MKWKWLQKYGDNIIAGYYSLNSNRDVTDIYLVCSHEKVGQSKRLFRLAKGEFPKLSNLSISTEYPVGQKWIQKFSEG